VIAILSETIFETDLQIYLRDWPSVAVNFRQDCRSNLINGTLPPGLQKRLEPFPEDLERRLPSLPTIYRRGRIGEDVVILDTRTQRIIDIMHDIFGPR
jgi:hypothetical protein